MRTYEYAQRGSACRGNRNVWIHSNAYMQGAGCVGRWAASDGDRTANARPIARTRTMTTFIMFLAMRIFPSFGSYVRFLSRSNGHSTIHPSNKKVHPSTARPFFL